MMDPTHWRILLIDDDPDDYLIVRGMLSEARQNRYELEWVSNYARGREALLGNLFDVVLVDYNLGAEKGAELIQETVQNGYPAPMILLTGRGSFEVDVLAMQCGAADYLTKGEINARYLERSIRYAIERKRSQQILEKANDQLSEANRRLSEINQELGMKNQQLAGLFSNTPAGLVLFDANAPFRVLMNNAVYLSLLPEPYRSRGIMGLSLLDYLHTAAEDGILTIFQEAVTTGEARVMQDFRFTGLPQGTTWWNWHVNPILSEGKVVQLVHMVVDVTEQHLAEQAIQESERLFRATFENAAVGIAHIGFDGRFIRVNQRLCDITGYPRDELLQKTFQDITVREDLDSDLAQADRLARGEISHYTMEKRYIRKDGSVVWVNLTGSAQRDPAGALEYFIGVVEDISQRKTLEMAIRESEATLQALFNTDAVYAGLLTRNPDDVAFSVVNPKLAAFYGLTPETMAGKTAREVGLFDQVAALPIFQHCLAVGKPIQLEYALMYQGKESWFHGSISPIASDSNSRPRFAFIAVDITARKQAEGEIRKNQTRLQQLLDTTYDGVWQLNREGKIDYINERGAAILGYSVEEMLGCKPADFLFAEDANAATGGFFAQRPGKNDPEECRMRHKDGEAVWIFASSTPMLDTENQLTGVLAMFSDITKRKKAEQALRQSEQRFRIALASVPMFVFTMDRDLRYTWVHNPPQGSDEDQWQGKRDDEMFPRETAEQYMALKRTVIETGQGMQQEVRERDGDEWSYFYVRFEPLMDAEGKIVGLTGAKLDITQQRRLEAKQAEYLTQVEVQRRLMEQREMERMDIARDLHDGPLQELTAISLFVTDAIGTDSKEERIAKLKAIQQMLLKQSHEIRVFCNELRPPALAPFGLEKAIRSHITDFKYRHSNVNVHLKLMPDQQKLPETVRMALFRIYQELLNNIAKYAKARDVWVTLDLPPNEVILEVEDNGVGFDPPADWIAQARSGHLGLIGMRERAAAMNGQIEVDSKPGRGTRIRITVGRS